ncbi:MAG: GNAT family N-acetyltransferase [Alphaproteobacteria bacterium]|nr:GNAT family N-acetyltransferase [Alphaproteobacteria bacterium]
MERLIIEIAEENDAEDIAKLSYQVGKMHDDALPEYFKPTGENEHLRIVMDMLKESKTIIFKAVYEEKICGFLMMDIKERIDTFYARYGIITNFGVDAFSQCQGIGTALVKEAELYAQKVGLKALDADVFAFNTRAMNFFEKKGFIAIDVYMRKFLENKSMVDDVNAVKVLEAEDKDVKDILQIYNQMRKIHELDVLPFFKTKTDEECEQTIKDILQNKSGKNLINFKAVVGNKITGFLFLIIQDNESEGLTYEKKGYVGKVVVDEHYRKMGIGTKLFKTAENYLLKNGIKVLDLDVSAFNQNAFDFYKNLGFVVIDTYMRKVL